MRYRWFHWRWVCRTIGWLSNVWICAHTCPVIRHCYQESKVKKTCADYDLAILRSYRYIPSYTKYNLVYTIFLWCWVGRTVGWLSNVWICVHTCPVIRHLNLESKVKNKVCWLWLGYTSFRPVYTKLYYVQLGIYWEIPPFTWNQAQAVLRARFVSAARLCRASLATFFLSPVCSTDRPPRRGLPRPNCHSHGCAPRNPAHKSISEYIPVYTSIYQSVHSIKQYILVCTQYISVYTGISRYIPDILLYTSISWSIHSLSRYIPVCTVPG